MKEQEMVKYFCKSCGRIFEIELEEDEHTTKVTCAYCHKKCIR